MNFDKIKGKLKDYAPKPVDISREYAVTIPLYFNKTTGEWELVYEVRALNINQPNEISFPGGKLEKGESFLEAAVRETCEELNLENQNIEILGELDFITNPGVLIIRSFLILIKDVDLDKIEFNRAEVSQILRVPLKYFLENSPLEYSLDMKVDFSEDFPYELIPNGKDYKFRKAKNIVLFYKYNSDIIWGFTAKLTRRFIQIYKDISK